MNKKQREAFWRYTVVCRVPRKEYGVYDTATGGWVKVWSGRGARQKAERCWHEPVGR